MTLYILTIVGCVAVLPLLERFGERQFELLALPVLQARMAGTAWRRALSIPPGGWLRGHGRCPRGKTRRTRCGHGSGDLSGVWDAPHGWPVCQTHLSGTGVSDATSVVFDAIHAARARNSDVLIVDTADRLHTKDIIGNRRRSLEWNRQLACSSAFASKQASCLLYFCRRAGLRAYYR